MTITPDGVLIVGGASTPLVYKAHPSSTIAEKFVDVTEGLNLSPQLPKNFVGACLDNGTCNDFAVQAEWDARGQW